MQPVSVVRTQAAYPHSAPYHPSQAYPEYPFPDHIAGEENAVYEGVRQLLYQLGYDKEHYASKAWNPLGWLITPGLTVVVCWRTLDREKLNKNIRLVALGRAEG